MKNKSWKVWSKKTATEQRLFSILSGMPSVFMLKFSGFYGFFFCLSFRFIAHRASLRTFSCTQNMLALVTKLMLRYGYATIGNHKLHFTCITYAYVFMYESIEWKVFGHIELDIYFLCLFAYLSDMVKPMQNENLS